MYNFKLDSTKISLNFLI